jgi:prepilin-type N-terminal cleavage/methylation domain-containing protein
LKRKYEGKALKILSNKRGLTLLELIISIVLIGTILLVVSGAMRLGYRSINSGEKKIDYLERLRSSLTIINSQIQSGKTQSNEKEFYFEGTEGFLKIATNYSIWGGQKGHVIVEYQVKTDPGGMQSLAASENVMGVEKKNETQLLSGFNAIYFEYFLRDATEKEGTWVEEWDNNGRIPQKIRLHLVQGSKKFSIIFPVKVQM